MKRIIMILNWIDSIIKCLTPFLMMAILNAITGIGCLLMGARFGAIIFGIFGFIWGVIALAVALKNQFWLRYKADANPESPKP